MSSSSPARRVVWRLVGADEAASVKRRAGADEAAGASATRRGACSAVAVATTNTAQASLREPIITRCHEYASC
jgi:hypothetical protein